MAKKRAPRNKDKPRPWAWALLPILILYISLLSLAALEKVSMVTQAWKPLEYVTFQARTVLNMLGISPGLHLFYDTSNWEISVRGDCLTVWEPGTTIGAVINPVTCDSNSPRMYLTPQEMVISQVLYDGLAYSSVPVNGSALSLGAFHYVALADQLCSQRGTKDLLRFRWAQRFRNIRTGQEMAIPRAKFEYNCGQKSMVSHSWPQDLQPLRGEITE